MNRRWQLCEQSLKTLTRHLVANQTVWALFSLGRKEEASATLEQFVKENPQDNRGLATGLQALLAASMGQERVAEEKIKLAVEKGKGFGHFHHTAYHIASAYALMNKNDAGNQVAGGGGE